MKDAEFHWKSANDLSPQSPAYANNLAYLILKTEPKQLQRALDLANLAVAKNPRDANFRDTRGQILAKMEKYEEALIDLRAALPASQNKEALHRILAEVFSKLEITQMAAEHLRQANELKRQREKN